MSASSRTALLDDLAARGLLQDSTDLDALRERMAEGPVVLYHGIDPSASSLHIGNYVGILVLRRFQDAGHKPIVLIGGATGMIGDPGGRSEERNLLDEQSLQSNIDGIRAQIERLVDFDGSTTGVGAELVSNYDWTKDVGVLDFLRDVGKHVTVNQMVARDSVKSRMQSEHGISYTEFSYMLLQAFDFWWLHTNMDCDLQIGGSDQWGNLAQGVDLIRRRTTNTAHALTWPLITRSDGQKFGKSVSGAVWLDPDMTSPYEFHQYWMSVDDADVERYLKQLTLMPLDDIASVMAEHTPEPHRRIAQARLADEVTTLIHGSEATTNAKRAAAVLFGGEAPSPEDLQTLRGIAPETEVAIPDLGAEVLVDLLTATGLASSRRDARQAVSDGAVRWNGEKVENGGLPPFETGMIGLLQKGRKNRHLVVFS
ncbi:MAG: tyrosine--tRNA ligase [Acidimicrobiales bacterium]|nr:tyrosine--tRNA ligase [Acidimicrobiales bacterium]